MYDMLKVWILTLQSLIWSTFIPTLQTIESHFVVFIILYAICYACKHLCRIIQINVFTHCVEAFIRFLVVMYVDIQLWNMSLYTMYKRHSKTSWIFICYIKIYLWYNFLCHSEINCINHTSWRSASVVRVCEEVRLID